MRAHTQSERRREIFFYSLISEQAGKSSYQLKEKEREPQLCWED